MAPTIKFVTLQPETANAFNAYIKEAESGIEISLQSRDAFLWSDGNSDRAEKLKRGNILAEFWSGAEPAQVPHGLIHDWVGAVFIPGVMIESTLALIKDYDNHANVYKPSVMVSKVISHDGNDFSIYLRLLKKRIMTVVLDTYHEVHYEKISPLRWYCRSRTSKIAEVEDAGKPNESILPAETGYGFLWKLYSYWKLEGRSDGTVVECRAISLTRDIPQSLKWIIQPMVRSLPKDSLVSTLAATRQALVTEGVAVPHQESE